MEPESASQGFFARLFRWLKGQIVVEVPPENAVCEFDCRKEQCRYDEWASCERRLSYMASPSAPKHSQENKT